MAAEASTSIRLGGKSRGRDALSRGLVIALLSMSALSACCRKPWNVYPRSTPPDRSCLIGSATHGHEVYVWDCVDGKHVVVAQQSGEMTCRAPVEETSACGTTTSLERELEITPEKCRGALRDWQTK